MNRSEIITLSSWQQRGDAIAFWQTASTVYQIILAPQGILQASGFYETFIAPLCLWLGAGLLIMCLGEIRLGWLY